MPDKNFLEHYPLYRKLRKEFSDLIKNLPSPAINMHCDVCKSVQTFRMVSPYRSAFEHALDKSPGDVHGSIILVIYGCAACRDFYRYFLLSFDSEGKWVQKVGQIPSWEIAVDRGLEKLLSNHVDLYKRGLENESQGYGIGALAYYRRMIEEVIDQLLEEIQFLIPEKDRNQYAEALRKTKSSRDTEEKLKLVKDLLPEILTPNGINPLSILHDALSKGLHAHSDEECLELAAESREAIVFVVNQVLTSKKGQINLLKV